MATPGTEDVWVVTFAVNVLAALAVTVTAAGTLIVLAVVGGFLL